MLKGPVNLGACETPGLTCPVHNCSHKVLVARHAEPYSKAPAGKSMKCYGGRERHHMPLSPFWLSGVIHITGSQGPGFDPLSVSYFLCRRCARPSQKMHAVGIDPSAHLRSRMALSKIKDAVGFEPSTFRTRAQSSTTNLLR